MFTDIRIDIIQYEQTLVDMFVELYSKQNIRLGEDWHRPGIHREVLVRPIRNMMKQKLLGRKLLFILVVIKIVITFGSD